MASAQALMNVGVPAEVAKRVGWEPISVTTAGTTQGAAGGVLTGSGNKLVSATIHSGTGAVTLPADSGPGDEVLVVNVSANAGQVFPASGDTINGNSADASITLAAAGSAGAAWLFVRVDATRWVGIGANDAT